MGNAYTHIIILASLGQGTNSHVPLSMNTNISKSMVALHASIWRTPIYVLGSHFDDKKGKVDKGGVQATPFQRAMGK